MDTRRSSFESASGRVELAYRDVGSGEPLLLLHGFFGTGDDFQYLPGLGPDARRIVPDLRGHGRSSMLRTRFSFRDAADDVLRLLAQLGIARCRAVGLSGGALVLLRMALRAPQLLERMVLVSACDGFPEPARRFMEAYVEDAPRHVEALRAQHAGGDAQVAALLDSARAFAAGDDDAGVSRAELRAIRAPALIVTGDRDPLYSVAVARRLAESLPDATLWVIEGEGHTPVFGLAREEFIARSNTFLSA